jgi:hypothetical protein
MTLRLTVSIGAVAWLVGLAPMVAAQAPQGSKGTPTAKSAAAAPATGIPRTAWGAPDLNGLWNGNSMTPLERPAQYADKAFLTEDEAAALEKRQRETALVDRPPREGEPGTYNVIWTDPSFKVIADRRTSLIVDPPDGKIPFTPEGRKAETRARERYGKGPYDSYTDLDTGERCITDGVQIHFNGYNNNYQIVQTPDHVAILHEYYHEFRIVPLDGRPHANVPSWLGDSRGRWEGDTLVVETTNFAEKSEKAGIEWASAWRATRATTRLVERFTRKADHIEYEFTWSDPTMFSRPWTARFNLNRQAVMGVTEGPLYEYACHEGNYAVPNTLSGQRAKDKEAEEAARRGSQ